MSVPSEPIRAEIEALLQEDRSRVGDVYRRPDMTPEEIASDLGVSTHNFVFNMRYTIRALVEGVLPGGDALRGQVAAKVRSLSREPSISGEARDYLSDLYAELTTSDSGAQRSRSSQPRSPVRPRSVSTRATSLRRQTEDEIRERVNALVVRISAETQIDPVDYWAVTTSQSPLDVIVRLIREPGESEEPSSSSSTGAG